MKPNCSETTAFSGRIFQKTSTPPLLPEKMRAPKADRVLPALRDSSRGGDSSLPSFTSPCISTWPQSSPFWLTSSSSAWWGEGSSCLFSWIRRAVCVPPLTLKHFGSLFLICGFAWPPKWFLAAGEKQKSAWKSK